MTLCAGGKGDRPPGFGITTRNAHDFRGFRLCEVWDVQHRLRVEAQVSESLLRWRSIRSHKCYTVASFERFETPREAYACPTVLEIIEVIKYEAIGLKCSDPAESEIQALTGFPSTGIPEIDGYEGVGPFLRYIAGSQRFSKSATANQDRLPMFRECGFYF